MPRMRRLACLLGLLCRAAGRLGSDAQPETAAQEAVAAAQEAAKPAHEAAAPRRRSYFINLVVAAENPFLLVNVEYFLRHAATHSAVVDTAYKVTMNGPNPQSRRLVFQHATLVNGNEPLSPAPVRQLQRHNTGFDFGGHLDALAEEAACCPRGPAAGGGASCLSLVRRVEGSPLTIAKSAATVLCGSAAAAHAANAGGVAGTGTIRRFLKWSQLRYDGYILLNCGVRGPIYPTYMPRGWHWLSAFDEKLTAIGRETGGVALVGTSLACLAELPAPRGGGVGPRVEAFTFGIAREALLEVLKKGTSFQNHHTKDAAVVMGEYALSLSVLGAAGKEWNIGSLMRLHHNVNFRDQKEWGCNKDLHPTRINSYEGMTVHPLEVLFHKGRWHTTQQDPNKREMDIYSAWINKRGLRR